MQQQGKEYLYIRKENNMLVLCKDKKPEDLLKYVLELDPEEVESR